jgi:hypothetical protein
MSPDLASENAARAVVLSCVDAINRGEFAKGRACVTYDMTFVGPLGQREGGDVYFADLEKMKLKYDVKKTFVEGDDVCLIYDLAIGGKTVPCCGLYHLRGGKIDSLRVLFDPRPLLTAK